MIGEGDSEIVRLVTPKLVPLSPGGGGGGGGAGARAIARGARALALEKVARGVDQLWRGTTYGMTGSPTQLSCSLH